MIQSQFFSQIELTIEDESSRSLFKNNKLESFSSAKKLLNKKLIDYQSEGYISCYYDTLLSSVDQLKVKLIKGKKYKWGELRIDENLKSLWESQNFNNRDFNYETLSSSISTVLSFYENNGYPFVQASFDSLTIEGAIVNGNLIIQKNQFVVIDSIIVKGGSKTSKNYLTRWLGLNKGKAYNQELISSLGSKLRNLTLVSVIREPEVFFSQGRAEVVLYLEDNSSNRFDGILGLNPDENSGKINVVGELKVDLRNAFRRGEKIYLNWEKVKTNSQTFNIDFTYPFLFKTRFGIHTEMNYFRQDTSFANLRGVLGVSYFINESQEFSLSAEIIESNSLLNNSNAIMIPSVNSVSTLYYGVGYKLNTLDYRINPRKGWNLELALRTGNKTIIKNPEIESLDYQDIKETSTQLKSDISISCFLPLFKRNTAHFKLQSGNLIGDNVFVNELYQIGGNKSLRGFNQQSILTSNYYIFTTEFRYLFSRNSNFFSFFDLAFYENNSIESYQKDTPFGFGLGVNFQTGAGIFSLSYGLGKQQNNPVLIKNGKI
ncbi:MAG: POTRA domain-containing protein, partial [Flavobacteriales bacterium]